jgi:hypothetical protein
MCIITSVGHIIHKQISIPLFKNITPRISKRHIAIGAKAVSAVNIHMMIDARPLEMLHYPDQCCTKGNHIALDRIPPRSHAPS